LGSPLVALNVAGLFVVAIWLRMTELDHLPGINGDEAWYGIQAVRLLEGEPLSWRTPTNNLLNPFFFLPLVLVHLWQEPSAAALRWPALVSGVLALPLNYWLCRRALDHTTAIVTTVLLAVLPVNIAYSRFGWDASQTLLATLPAVYLPLLAVQDEAHRQRWLICAALAFLASLIVHPTNIFTAPLLVVPALWAWRDEFVTSVRARPVWQPIAACGLGGVCLLAVGWLARHWLTAIGERILTPGQLGEFAWNYQRLFSGLTVYRYLAGSNLPPTDADVLLVDLAWWLFLGLAAYGLWQGWRRDENKVQRDGCLLCGWAIMACGFFLVAGPKAIAPHYERYGLCLIAPGAVLLGRGLSAWFLLPRARPVALAASLALAWLTLLAFQQHYVAFIHRTGGMSHETFRTAAVEPKQAALEQVLHQREPGGIAWIVTSEYWNEKPLTYLAAGQDRLRVESWLSVRESGPFLAALQEGRVWFVEFSDGPACREVCEFLRERGWAYRETAIKDYAGRPVISVIGPRPTDGI
jgi:hypothetical protein